MKSKTSTRQNSLDRTQGAASDINPSSKKTMKGTSSRSSSIVEASSASRRASSVSRASLRPSRRSSTDSGKSLISVNESLFSHTGSQCSADSVESGVIPALYDKIGQLDTLSTYGSDIYDKVKDTRPMAIEQVTVNRSGRAGVRQYGRQEMEKRVDNNKLRSILARHTPRQGWIPSEKEYRLRHTNKDPALGTDQLVVRLGSEFGTYTGKSSVKHIFGKRSKETRGFDKVADGLGLRPRTLDSCSIKKVRHGRKSADQVEKNALWNAFEDPKTFNKQVEAAALKITGGVVGFKGEATKAPVDTTRKSERDTDEDQVTLNKIREESYLDLKGQPEGKLGRTFLRMPNKPRDSKAERGFGMQKDKVKVTNGEIIRKSQEIVVGQLPESDEPVYDMTEDIWGNMTPRRRLPKSDEALEHLLQNTWKKMTPARRPSK